MRKIKLEWIYQMNGWYFSCSLCFGSSCCFFPNPVWAGNDDILPPTIHQEQLTKESQL